MNAVATSISGTNVQLVVSSLSDQSQVVCIDRPYATLEKLHSDLVKKYGTVNMPSFPSFPSQPNDTKLALLCSELTTYFKHDTVQTSEELRSLVDEELSVGPAQMTAIDFILQPFERASCFEVEDYDIEFYAEFHTPFPMYTEIIHAATKYQTTSKPIEGMYSCTRPGVVTLRWDNSYSRLRNKTVLYLAHVVDKKMMDSAFLAADTLDQAMKAGPTTGNCLHMQKSPALVPRTSTSLVPSLELLTPQWFMDGLVQTTTATAGYAAKLFGSRSLPALPSSQPTTASPSQSSLMEELNGLNMQLLQRVERLEDSLAKIAVERDQGLSRIQLAAARQRLCRERQNWPAILAERDALLLEKHRWAMIDEFDTYAEQPASPKEEAHVHLSENERMSLEKELGQAELTLLRVRAQLGYSLHQQLPVGAGRLEQLAQDLAEAKSAYDRETEQRALEIAELNQQIVKYKSHKKVLVTELRNLKRETEGQVAVAMAEACEARMVNQRLKRQNELLLSQIRTMVDDEEKAKAKSELEDSPLPSTITAADIALLNGQPEGQVIAKTDWQSLQPNPYRQPLIQFFEKYDPSQLENVEEMLESYRGVEDSLMESLQLKYCFQDIQDALATQDKM
ncbi:hypothetical protein Ae201684P_000604 [Aphanomyces euteiches]|nr:hypothetical protein Ae201684P_000604 [Aphanomyces euteiches]